MSVQTSSHDEDPVECGECGDEVPDDETVKDAYCSRECYYLNKGSGTLNRIRSDHTVCPTCFATLKEVERPDEADLIDRGVSDTIRDIFVGFQSPTQHADHVETTIHAGEYAVQDTVATALGCECGTSGGPDPDDAIERVEGARVVRNLLRELRQRYERGELDNQPSKERLFDALRERGREWDYAVGRCLYG